MERLGPTTTTSSSITLSLPPSNPQAVCNVREVSKSEVFGGRKFRKNKCFLFKIFYNRGLVISPLTCSPTLQMDFYDTNGEFIDDRIETDLSRVSEG